MNDVFGYFLKQAVLPARLKLYEESYPDYHKLFQKIYDADPSHNKRYTKWMIEQCFLNSMSDIVATVEYFHRHINAFKGEDRNINSYKTLKDLEDKIKEHSSRRQQKIQQKVEGAKKIWEEENFVLLRIDSKQAAQFYGSGTKWCITMPDTIYFEEYCTGNYLFYFLIDKKPQDTKYSKIAFAVENAPEWGTRTEIFDAEDKEIDRAAITNKLNTIINKVLRIIQKDSADNPSNTIANICSGKLETEEFKKFWQNAPLQTRKHLAETGTLKKKYIDIIAKTEKDEIIKYRVIVSSDVEELTMFINDQNFTIRKKLVDKIIDELTNQRQILTSYHINIREDILREFFEDNSETIRKIVGNYFDDT